MSTLVIAEKPSVARDIARVLGAGGRGSGFLHGNGYRITWALGHLVQFAEPDDYGGGWQGRWSPAQLPMIPECWRLKPQQRTAEQLAVVGGLMTDAETDRLVCATDAGREGELIFRLIYEHTGCRKPFDRLWVSSLTDASIRAGFAALRPGSAYDALAAAARARAQADWLIGMNLTRAYTVHNHVLCTIGRVQTPTLAMICARDAEIAAFQRTYFWELVAHLAEGFGARLIRDGETRIAEKAEAERLQQQLAPHRTGIVKDLERKHRREPPPPLYDLTSLQRDANRRLAMTAAEVLQVAQQLYERDKLISYPRTESRHISEDMVPQLPRILGALDHPCAPAALARLRAGHRLGRAYVDKTKLTDHHAILPTGKPVPAGLSGRPRGVYDLIQTRFVAVFLPDQELEETRVTLDIGGSDFTARGVRELVTGWREADPPPRRTQSTASRQGETRRQGGKDQATAADEQALPPLEQGQEVHVDSLEVRQGETSPPRPYTDASLLSAMKNAGRGIEDKALARAMRGSGLGTPATRAEIIEKLIRTGYVERQKKQLRSTEKGRVLISAVAPELKRPELTADWEQRLKEVEDGAGGADAFYQGICALLRELIPRVWKGPAFTPAQIAAARDGRGEPAARRGRRTRTRVSAADGKASTRVAASPVGLTCPKCRRGHIIQGRRGFGCDRYREGCNFVVWREVAGKVLTERQIAELIQRGRTARISGLRDEAGRAVDGRLVLDGDGTARVQASPRTVGEGRPRKSTGRRTGRRRGKPGT